MFNFTQYLHRLFETVWQQYLPLSRHLLELLNKLPQQAFVGHTHLARYRIRSHLNDIQATSAASSIHGSLVAKTPIVEVFGLALFREDNLFAFTFAIL